MRGSRTISDPRVPPTAQVTGIKEKPRAMFVSSVSSAIILFTTPAFPLSIPFKKRLAKLSNRSMYLGSELTHLKTSPGKERERPKTILETMVPRRPHRNTGLRPTLSERRLHWNTLTACAAKYKETFLFGQKAAEDRGIQVTYY